MREYKKGQITRDAVAAYESDIEISTKDASSYFPISAATCFTPPYVVGATITIYTDRGIATTLGGETLREEALSAKYIKVTVEPFDKGDNNTIKIGSLVGGIKKEFDPPLEWAFSDNEVPNQENLSSRSGVRWTYEKGPAARTLTLKMEGDLDEQFRYSYRKILSGITKYAKNPVFISLGATTIHLYDEQLALVQFDGSSQLNNEGWKYDETIAKWMPIGSMGFKFTEIV